MFYERFINEIFDFVHHKDRNNAKKLHEDAGIPFIEVFLSTPLSVCESRDVKGLYQKARSGLIKGEFCFYLSMISCHFLLLCIGFTGIDAPYEAPPNPDVTIDTSQFSIDRAIEMVIEKLAERVKSSLSIFFEAAFVKILQ